MEQIYDSRHSGQEVDNAVDAVQTTIPNQLTQIGLKLGDLSQLHTTAKNNAVAAINEVNEKVSNIASGKYYGYYGSASALPTSGNEDGYAYVGATAPYSIYNGTASGGRLTWTDSGSKISSASVADEEDITQDSNGKLSLKDRGTTDGMGYIIIRKNKTFASQVTKANTIYEIRYDFDLDGADVTIPENCVLEFDGGSLSNVNLAFGENCKIENGKFVNISEFLLVSNCKLLNSSFSNNDNGYNGVIKVNGSNIVIYGCKFEGFKVDSVDYSTGSPNTAVIKTNWHDRGNYYSNLVIESNYFGNYLCDTANIARAIAIHEVHNVSITNNIFFGIENINNSEDFDVIHLLCDTVENTSFPFVNYQHPNIGCIVDSNIFDVINLKSIVKVQAGDVSVSNNIIRASGSIRNFIRCYQSEKIVITGNSCSGIDNSSSFEVFGCKNVLISDNFSKMNSAPNISTWIYQCENVTLSNNEFICARIDYHYNNVGFIIRGNRYKITEQNSQGATTNYASVTSGILPSIKLIDNIYEYLAPTSYHKQFIELYNDIEISGCSFVFDGLDTSLNKKSGAYIVFVPYKNTRIAISNCRFGYVNVLFNTQNNGTAVATKPSSVDVSDVTWGSISIKNSDIFSSSIDKCSDINFELVRLFFRYNTISIIDSTSIAKLNRCSFYNQVATGNIILRDCYGFGLDQYNAATSGFENQLSVGTMVMRSGIPAYWNGSKWVDANGFVVESKKGTTATRPTLTSSDSGFQYYDTDLGKYICWNGTAWVNMDGSALS